MDLATIAQLDEQGWKVDSLYLHTRHGTFAVHTRWPDEVTATRTYTEAGQVLSESLATHADCLTVKGALARIGQRIAALEAAGCSSGTRTASCSEVRP